MNPIHANKYTAVPSLTIFVTGAAILLASACSKQDRTDLADKAKDTYQDAKGAAVRGWENVKSYTFEKRSVFALELKARQADLDANISKLRAEYSEEKASESRKAAMAELKNSEADYKAKLSALGTATADTWDATRDNVVAAWDRLQAAYAKARAD